MSVRCVVLGAASSSSLTCVMYDNVVAREKSVELQADLSKPPTPPRPANVTELDADGPNPMSPIEGRENTGY